MVPISTAFSPDSRWASRARSEQSAAHAVAVEINAKPYRLDLDWRWHERALALGCLLSINPDAHSIAELDLIKQGVRSDERTPAEAGGGLAMPLAPTCALPIESTPNQ
jgi:histidinol phosphatase-like PHP family hydrolase